MPSNLPRLVTRIPNNINEKFLYICDKEDRTASNMISKLIKEFVEQYEIKHGEIETNHKK
jgi:hypothetical protein